MLPAAIPKARIMRFGYESLWYGPNAVKQRVHNIAYDLLLRLNMEREVQSNDILYILLSGQKLRCAEM
jgi:hypothetical protein